MVDYFPSIFDYFWEVLIDMIVFEHFWLISIYFSFFENIWGFWWLARFWVILIAFDWFWSFLRAPSVLGVPRGKSWLKGDYIPTLRSLSLMRSIWAALAEEEMADLEPFLPPSWWLDEVPMVSLRMALRWFLILPIMLMQSSDQVAIWRKGSWACISFLLDVSKRLEQISSFHAAVGLVRFSCLNLWWAMLSCSQKVKPFLISASVLWR